MSGGLKVKYPDLWRQAKQDVVRKAGRGDDLHRDLRNLSSVVTELHAWGNVRGRYNELVREEHSDDGG